ncbi:hypothetical protein PanWU01x14_195810 [Parasponia andersonii]|uniref:Uncharacterized protein n=1 Tax=Parasponia andersonii TaxID=3476 RepID=A0A2P5BZW2_PARAD|nr:hypothetical protein PanWU01x14_195810 [Parasponia andersonii]
MHLQRHIAWRESPIVCLITATPKRCDALAAAGGLSWSRLHSAASDGFPSKQRIGELGEKERIAASPDASYPGRWNPPGRKDEGTSPQGPQPIATSLLRGGRAASSVNPALNPQRGTIPDFDLKPLFRNATGRVKKGSRRVFSEKGEDEEDRTVRILKFKQATRVARDTKSVIGLPKARVGPITDLGHVRPSPTLTLTAGGSEPLRVLHLNTMESNSRFQTQTEHLMQSWVGMHKGQAVLTERRFTQILPMTDSSRRRRWKSGYGDIEEITEISARDF